MTTLPLKASIKELHSFIRFCGQNKLAQMPLTQRCIQCMVTSIYNTYLVLKFACHWESVTDEEWPGYPLVSATDATITAVDSVIRSDQHMLIYGINV